MNVKHRERERELVRNEEKKYWVAAREGTTSRVLEAASAAAAELRRNLTKQFVPKQTTASGLLVNKQHIYF
jgi:hypothetical protein